MADIICRWRNGTPVTVVELVNTLPHELMPSDNFHTYMKEHWRGDFFRSPYQLACQLGLYYESEDGYYHPRYNHNIKLDEAKRYLERWIVRYYIPNPYTGSDGFKKLKCPTFVVKSLYDYVSAHPGCLYTDAYKAVFLDDATNNNDIMRNYINNYSKVLTFTRAGKLEKTDYNVTKVFDFMEKNNKKQFFENFSEEDSVNKMDAYLSADIDARATIFHDYLISIGKAESSAKQYAYTHPKNEEVLNIVKEETKEISLFKVIDAVKTDKIYNLVNQLQANKNQNNALSATISNYRKFLDYLEGDDSNITSSAEDISVKKEIDQPKLIVEQNPFSISKMIEYIAETGLIYTPELIKRFAFSLMTKPFVILSGLAGSGKTQLALAFASALVEDKEKQLCTLSVGADWTNREPMLGFPNALNKNEYVRPESGVLDLLIAANENQDRPYFLILDEMNMSYVERYFADFLSAMESHEEIKLWNGCGLDADDESYDSTPKAVKLPKNLFIIGTINVDETTYMFSPKVLDRANVIEFKIAEDEMKGFLNEMKEVDRDSINCKGADMGCDFVQRAIKKNLPKNEESEYAASTLDGFFRELKKVNAEFGYRSATEIFRFIRQAQENDDTDNKMSSEQILDSAIVQKLLPKLHGSRKKLEPVLQQLWKMCYKDAEQATMAITHDNVGKAVYKDSADKIQRMYDSAYANGFTSFAEA